MSEVMAIGARRNNAELMLDCQQLGYLDGLVLDATYGLGRFWSLTIDLPHAAIDLDPARDVTVADFRQLPFAANKFDTVVLDPPYKLNGTSTGKGVSASDADYGVSGKYVNVAQRHGLICDGIVECLRVTKPGGYLLAKCQDQVCSGRVHWQTHIFTRHAAARGAMLVDMLHVQGHREQPPGRRQLHARRDYSTLLVLQVRDGR